MKEATSASRWTTPLPVTAAVGAPPQLPPGASSFETTNFKCKIKTKTERKKPRLIELYRLFYGFISRAAITIHLMAGHWIQKF